MTDEDIISSGPLGVPSGPPTYRNGWIALPGDRVIDDFGLRAKVLSIGPSDDGFIVCEPDEAYIEWEDGTRDWYSVSDLYLAEEPIKAHR